ncbi:MAG: hypothetical protein KatS3mg043_0287 [Rhodothermaceae bacterium]|nr:MAG: hypothetical protein KatS3mg043_0287 [Rhodothermaceae bacterium]
MVVASAGNSGHTTWRIITSPADGDSVIAVGAVDANGVRAFFSSVGPTADGRIKPDVAALGMEVHLAASDTGYGLSQGTSFSAPMVAGIVALLLQVNPDLDPATVRDILRSTASRAGNPDNTLGWGLVDADAAVALAEALATPVENGRTPPAALRVDTYPSPLTGPAVFEVRSPVTLPDARLHVYDLLGRRVAVPFEGALSPGLNRIPFDPTGLAPGLYLFTLETATLTRHGKLVVVR